MGATIYNEVYAVTYCLREHKTGKDFDECFKNVSQLPSEEQCYLMTSNFKLIRTIIGQKLYYSVGYENKTSKMSDCDLLLTEFQLGMLAALIHKERMQVYDDQLMIEALKDILSRIVKAKTDVEKQV